MQRARSLAGRRAGRLQGQGGAGCVPASVPINDKMIVLGLQAHNYWGGLISYFNADRGGQAYAYKPELP